MLRSKSTELSYFTLSDYDVSSLSALSQMNRPVLSDLMAVAIARTLLLELGHEFVPDEEGGVAAEFGSLEVWIHAHHASLGGRTPIDVLREADGQAQLRAMLEQVLQHDGTAPAIRDEE